MRTRAVAENGRWEFVGGDLGLDFANTASWHASAAPEETFASYGDLVRWCREAGVLRRPAVTRLLREAARRPAAAARLLERAVALREVIYRVALALARGAAPAARDVATLDRWLRAAWRHLRLSPAGAGLRWSWESAPRRLDACLWPVVDAAAELVISERRARIRQCADDRGCGWLFLDATRNRSRRWCSMASCGNRAKALRFAAGRRRSARRKRGATS